MRSGTGRPRVLLLYWHPGSAPQREAVRHSLAMLAAVVRAAEVIPVNAVGGAPPWLRHVRPHVVLLHSTFLGIRWLTSFDAWRERSSWLNRLVCLKVAFPQDEYDHCDVLDEWLADLAVDDVFTIFPGAVDRLYQSRAGGARFHPALTGYVGEELAAAGARHNVPLAGRPTGVVYRATRLPFWYGSHGQLKSDLAAAAVDCARALGLSHDISALPADAIMGPAWLDFLATGRGALGCESGSSAIDRRGELRRAIAEMVESDPSVGFAEVSSRLPADWDDDRFFAISPRHLEAATTRTCQVLVEGEYSGIMRPWEHYVPVRRDLSDMHEALSVVSDLPSAQAIADRAYEEVALRPDVQATAFRRAVRAVIEDSGLDLGSTRAVLPPRFARVAAGARGFVHGRARELRSAVSGR